tara:strand:- start:1663 stop:1944 length:282 start_codon:yes stop_codon:yes gene_type:complete
MEAYKEINKTAENIKEELSYINEQALFADGFDDALIGVDMVHYTAVYDVDKCVDVLMKESGMTFEEAQEYFEFNTLNAYVGEYTPKYIKIYNK